MGACLSAPATQQQYQPQYQPQHQGYYQPGFAAGPPPPPGYAHGPPPPGYAYAPPPQQQQQGPNYASAGVGAGVGIIGGLLMRKALRHARHGHRRRRRF